MEKSLIVRAISNQVTCVDIKKNLFIVVYFFYHKNEIFLRHRSEMIRSLRLMSEPTYHRLSKGGDIVIRGLPVHSSCDYVA